MCEWNTLRDAGKRERGIEEEGTRYTCASDDEKDRGEGRNSNENIGSPKQIMNIENFHERSQMQREQHAGDMSNVTPLAIQAAIQSVIKLQASTSWTKNLLPVKVCYKY
ncbi:hypothetical protein ALC56_02069 [Trachymyrmex septentrionalis]|uniref:Uncharacterized protein n=1 Tax=Trachymyrmex septentrionalis TaxID=34720 RepID=A0A195FTQ2_9HYME|nr:hypothetical protein ALC56_02069 [Trachymyrmex septentrionalis]